MRISFCYVADNKTQKKDAYCLAARSPKRRSYDS